MTIAAEEHPSTAVAFRDATWKTRWLAVGVAFVLLLRGVSLVEVGWQSRLPMWWDLIVAGLAPQVFFLLFPIITRDPNGRHSFRIPGPGRCLLELGIAIPVTVGVLGVLVAVNFLVGWLWPGTSLTPEAMTNLAASPQRTRLYLILLFSFTFAPIAEEVFFRGFLQNALRARLPVPIAAIAQCLIFGFGHSFGAMHSGVAFVLGLALTALYEWRKTLVTPILAHAGINFVAAAATLAMMVVLANGPVLGVYGDASDAQCVIRQLVSDSAATEADLRVGDVITSIDGEPIRDYRQLVKTIRRYRPGDAIALTISRSGSMLEVTVVLRRRSNP